MGIRMGILTHMPIATRMVAMVMMTTHIHIRILLSLLPSTHILTLTLILRNLLIPTLTRTHRLLSTHTTALSPFLFLQLTVLAADPIMGDPIPILYPPLPKTSVGILALFPTHPQVLFRMAI